MPLRIGMFLYPAIAFFALRSKKSPPEMLWKVGAVSPETAVRPEGIGITDHRLVGDYIRSGMIKRDRHGLCHLNVEAFRRQRVKYWIVLGLVGVLLTAFAVFVLR